MTPFRELRIAVFVTLLMPVVVAALAGPVAAAGKTYLSLWQRCTATGGAATLTAERPPILYPFSGEQEARRYTVCYEGQRGFGDINRGGAQNYCSSFSLASYQVGCFGGTVSAAAFYAGFGQQMRSNKLVLSGDTLAVELSPGIMVVPLQPGRMERAMADARRAVLLLSGYAPLPPEGSFRSLAWDEARGIPLIGVTGPGDLPPVSTPPPAPAWVKALSTPLVSWPLCTVVLAFGAIAGFGFHRQGYEAASRMPLVVLTLVALAGVAMAGDAANLPDQAAARFKQQLAGVRGELAAIERDRAELKAIVTGGGASLVPLTEDALQRINTLVRQRTIQAPPPPTAAPDFWAIAYLLPAMLLLLIYGLRFVVGFHYLFVPHPAGKAVEPALRRGDLISERHGEAFAAALTPDPRDVADPPAAYRSWNFAAKARAYTQRMREDADLARAAHERDVARAAQKDAEVRLRAARSKLPWWQRWFWR